jgi:iron complex transport system substrate-binding protein
VPVLTRSLLLLLVLLLAGCQLTPDDQPADPHKRRPLKVQHAMGEVRVPYLSDAPVTLDPAALETALALGVKPRGSTNWHDDGSFPRYLGNLTRGVKWLGKAGQPDLAATKRVDPDVIIGNSLYQKRYFLRLSKIAPTVMSGVPLSEWKSDVRFFGESLGRSDEGEHLLIDWDHRAARARRAVKRAGVRRVQLPRSLTNELSQDFLDTVLEDAGLAPGSVKAHGRGGGIIAGRRVLAAISRSARVHRD